MKISVIGVGHLGSIHAKLLQQNNVAELCGIFDTDRTRLASLAQELNAKAFENVEDAISESDAVIVAAPTLLHYPIAVKALSAGKHCFIEKPITTTYTEAEELIHMAQETGVVVQVGHVERFNPALTALRGYTINPMFIEAHRLAQFRTRATDVSVVHDLMIHDIDIALSLVRSPIVRVDASGVAVLTDTTDIANARLTFANGCVANITASRISAKPMRKMRLFQKDAYISIDFSGKGTHVYRILNDDENIAEKTAATMLGNIDLGTQNKSIVFEQPPMDEVNAILEEHKTFVEALKGNRIVAVTASDAAEALRAAEIIAQTIDSGQKSL